MVGAYLETVEDPTVGVADVRAAGGAGEVIGKHAGLL